ncbi:MAG TPA: hypothetical protein VHQ90_01545 [Thermoanaerobaculia bacterium]|nr:hypothetical protein [Thermoanaerobaculia bacterium]
MTGQGGKTALAVGSVVLATVLGGALRFYGLGTPGLWLDEILHYDVATRATAQPWYRWALGFEFENGPLFYASLLAGRAVGGVAASDRLAAAVAGTATIPLVAAAGGLAGGTTAGVVAAWLLAVAPFNVFYSREGRPYALLALLGALMLLAFLVRGRKASACLGWGAALAAPYLAVSAFQVLAGSLLAAAACALVERFEGRRAVAPAPSSRRWLHLMAASGSGLLLLAALYGHYPRGPQIPSFPPNHGRLLLFVLNALAAAPLLRPPISPLAAVFAAASLAGFLALLARRRRVEAAALAGLAIAIAAAAWAGMAIPNHFFTLRYFTPVQPPFLVLAAIGITAAARGVAWAAGRLQRAPVGRAFVPALGAAAVLTLAAWNLPAAISSPYQKADWEGAARAIAVDAAGGPGTVLAANQWTATCLEFYLRRHPELRIREIQGAPAPLASAAAAQGGCWVAHGGWPRRPQLRRWARQFPPVWHGREESITVFRCAQPARPGHGPAPSVPSAAGEEVIRQPARSAL